MCLTSLATVAANGKQYPGHLVFIKNINWGSSTIIKGIILPLLPITNRTKFYLILSVWPHISLLD